jgi:hypothetical protein
MNRGNNVVCVKRRRGERLEMERVGDRDRRCDRRRMGERWIEALIRKWHGLTPCSAFFLFLFVTRRLANCTPGNPFADEFRGKETEILIDAWVG